MTLFNDVEFSEISGLGGDLGVITLNRPTVLNSLNHAMIKALAIQLQRWAENSSIKAVVIKAVKGSRAFCAGGDLRYTYERWIHHDASLVDFFRDEYQLNRLIFHYPKPYIAFLDGITMGGGVGISIHGSHRVATERLTFAMPETSIGFYPDVGGTYFLPRLTGEMGTYLGLTGARLACDDCVLLNLADHKVAAESLASIIDDLVATPLNTHAKQRVSAVINKYKIPVQTTSLLEAQAEIDECFAADSVEAISSLLTQSKQPICQEALQLFAKKSPTSLKVSLRALREGKAKNFDSCMQQEYRLTCRFLEGHDFLEGIRALIIDKDQKPNWQPATLNKVEADLINQYFLPLTEELL